MKTSLNLTPDTAYTLLTILREWRNVRTPLDGYMQDRYGDAALPEGWYAFKTRVVADQMARIDAVITQLED
jgi:hypothetical protein